MEEKPDRIEQGYDHTIRSSRSMRHGTDANADHFPSDIVVSIALLVAWEQRQTSKQMQSQAVPGPAEAFVQTFSKFV
jgi:hypothetical protein